MTKSPPRDPDLGFRRPLLAALPLLLVGVLAWSPNRAEVAPPAAARPDSARIQAAQRACDGPCVTPFGTPLGRAAGIEARSNCVSACLRLEASFVDPASGRIQAERLAAARPAGLEYAGVTYQCVEYARRWWIQALGLTFGDVPTAADMLALAEGKRLADQAVVPLGRALNGESRRAPRRGDLLIYAADPDVPDWRFGHVAVVVDIDLDQGWAALAEQNYDNRPWSDPERHARRIQLARVGGRYTLLDLAPGQRDHPEGGRIAGWIYPEPEPDLAPAR